MSHAVLAAIIIPVIVAILLAVWLTAVYRADRHPDQGAGSRPRRQVIGGAFRSTGGRQLMPRRDAPAGDTAGPSSSPEDEGGSE